MGLYYWLKLLAFISLIAVIGMGFNSYKGMQELDSSCSQTKDNASTLPHPYLCGEKLDIKIASIADIASVDGISTKGALAIHRFFQQHPQANIDDAINIRGIGPKKLKRLRERFY